MLGPKSNPNKGGVKTINLPDKLPRSGIIQDYGDVHLINMWLSAEAMEGYNYTQALERLNKVAGTRYQRSKISEWRSGARLPKTSICMLILVAAIPFALRYYPRYLVSALTMPRSHDRPGDIRDRGSLDLQTLRRRGQKRKVDIAKSNRNKAKGTPRASTFTDGGNCFIRHTLDTTPVSDKDDDEIEDYAITMAELIQTRYPDAEVEVMTEERLLEGSLTIVTGPGIPFDSIPEEIAILERDVLDSGIY